jgi:tetratricopeptide (TPR) repeat protein
MVNEYSKNGGGDHAGDFFAFLTGGREMNVYSNLILLGVTGIALMAVTSFRLLEPPMAFALAVASYCVFLGLALFNTKTWMEKKHGKEIENLKQTYEKKIRRLKYEHDTATLEKTIRNGTKTLIKNAVDYFKIENIKNEMPPSAAIQNLQLDKYGQIIELLADFSLILPDYEENREIVVQEINHQIEIYEIDEKHFADFLHSVMGKYLLTVDKKIKEKMKTRQALSSDSPPECDYSDCIKKGSDQYRAGNFEEAIRMFTRAIDIKPGADQAFYNRGITLKKMNMNEAALEDLKAAASLGHKKAREFLENLKYSSTQEWRNSKKPEGEDPEHQA